MKSIQRRLGISLLVMMLGAGVLGAVASSWLLDLGVRRYLAEHLRSETEMLLQALERNTTLDVLTLNQSRITPRYQRPLSGAYFHIEAGDQQWRSRSLWDHQWQGSTVKGLARTLQEGPSGQHLLAYQAQYQRAGQPVVITAALDYSPIQKVLLTVYGVFLGLGALALALLLWLQRLTIKNALKPLQIARQQIMQLQRGERARLNTEVPRELRPLTEQINVLLEHTEHNLKRSRSALGNLGHALKTPLAVLKAVLARKEGQDVSRAYEQVDEIERHIARELKRARLAGDVLPGAQFDCARDIQPLVRTLNMIYPHIQIETRILPSSIRLPWEREDVLEVLGNLLDNACKWAASQVLLSIQQTEQQLIMTVGDDGSGVDPESLDSLLVRGRRLDEQVAGHGLGLSIVRDSVEVWGGALEFSVSDLGGLEVILRFKHH